MQGNISTDLFINSLTITGCILLSGDHAKVALWRRKEAIKRTKLRRPDMYEKLDLSSKQDKKLLAELENEI